MISVSGEVDCLLASSDELVKIKQQIRAREPTRRNKEV